MTTGLLLFAHGARDARWAEPFERQGGHVRRDLPALAAHVQAAYPAVPVEPATAIGDDDMVLDRIAAVCVGGAPA